MAGMSPKLYRWKTRNSLRARVCLQRRAINALLQNHAIYMTESPENLFSAENFGHVCCKLLRGDGLVWPFGHGQAVVDAFINEVVFHGLECLVYDKLVQMADCPPKLRSALQQHALERAVWELRNRVLVEEAITSLAAAGVEALVYKGTALAYSLYANPVWRTRSDTDILVTADQVANASTVLVALGYQQNDEDAEISYYQTSFNKVAAEGGVHSIDLHWRINNSELLSQLFSYTELRQRAVPLTRLGKSALTVDAVNALLVACLHRGAHKQATYSAAGRSEMTGDRFIWLYDIDQLARRMTPVQWREFFLRAHAKGLTVICREGLQLACECFHTPLPPGWNKLLAVRTKSPTDTYFNAGSLRRMWMDLLACESIQAKVFYCRRLVFPPGAYMLKKYDVTRRVWLPLLYARRCIEGLIRRLPRVGER
jgi:hypothetical protein